jgi:SAM-dependent methyltransferase
VQDYDVQTYWNRVGAEISGRPGFDVVAGDPNPVSRYRRRRFVDTFLVSIPAHDKSVLELGCGPGGNLIELSRAAPSRLVGCDASTTMLEVARRNTTDLAGVALVETDGRRLPFADQEFQTSFTSTVLHHNHDEQLAVLLPELCRVTADTMVLIENTGTPKRQYYSFVLRPVAEYANFARANDFDLVESQLLNTAATDALAGSVRKMYKLFQLVAKRQRPALQEGEPVPRVVEAVERAGLVVTSRIDTRVPQRRGLTKMVYKRRGNHS